MTTTIDSLDQLREILNNLPEDETVRVDYCRAHGLPVKYGDVDMSDLPTFGGTELRDTDGIWSYDQGRLLTGSAAPYAIVPRHE